MRVTQFLTHTLVNNIERWEDEHVNHVAFVHKYVHVFSHCVLFIEAIINNLTLPQDCTKIALAYLFIVPINKRSAIIQNNNICS